MDRHFITGEIVVHEVAESLVDDELLHERRAYAHRHGADHLAARRLGIEDATRGADCEHAPHADLARRRVDARLDEMRAERRLLIPLREVAVFNCVLRDHATLARRLGQ